MADKSVTFGKGSSGGTVNVHDKLTLEMTGQGVNAAIGMIFDPEMKDFTAYHSYLREFGVRFAVVTALSDYKFVSEPEPLWDALMYSGVYEAVCEANPTAAELLKRSIDEAIDLRVKYIAGMTDINRLMDKLGGFLDGAEKTTNSVDINALGDMLNKVMGVGGADALKALAKDGAKIFGGDKGNN